MRGAPAPRTGDGLGEIADAWQQTYRTNVLTAVLLVEALKPMLARPGGRIVLISSASALQGNASPAYGAAKAALHGWVLALADTLGPDGITANVVAPGYTDGTELVAGRIPPDRKAALVSRIAVGRPAEPAEIAQVVRMVAAAGRDSSRAGDLGRRRPEGHLSSPAPSRTRLNGSTDRDERPRRRGPDVSTYRGPQRRGFTQSPCRRTPESTMERKYLDRLLATGGLVIAAVLVVAGALLTWAHNYVHTQVHDQLASQKIYFPEKGSEALASKEIGPYLNQYAGQQLVTGEQAKAYADHFIAVHIQEMTGGQTYAQLSAKSLANPNDAKLAGEVQTVFRGETLRGLLLNAYAFDTMGSIAFIASIAAYIGAGLLLVLAALGFRHSRRGGTVPGPRGAPDLEHIPA